ncbi:MAG: efflux RND transporter permease subunit [Nocardioidaceae bacterium]
MHWVTDPSTSNEEEVRITTAASKELRAIPGVRNFGAHIGQALLADEVVGVNFGENWISVDPDVDYDKTLASIQKVVDGYPGLYRDVQTYLKERIREVLTGSSEAVVVRIYGQDLDVLRAEADKVANILEGIDGMVDVTADLQVDVPQIQVRVDLAKAQTFGIKPGDVRRAASTLRQPARRSATSIAAAKPTTSRSGALLRRERVVTSVRQLPIDTADRGVVSLAQVASVRVTATPNAIERDGGSTAHRRRRQRRRTRPRLGGDRRGRRNGGRRPPPRLPFRTSR